MNWAFALLGLTPEADVASVKRAYARLLRTTRPDEDPAAFQRLHTAYKMVLAQVTKATPPAVTTPPAVPQEAPRRPETVQPPAAPPPLQNSATKTAPPPAVNLGALANEVIRAAVEAEDSSALLRRLQQQPEFWSIQVKQQAAQVVLQRLFQQPQPIAAYCMDALLRFFDLDHVLSGVNPVALQALRIRQRTLRELLPEHHHEFARRIGLMRNGLPDVSSLRKDLAFLQRPFRWMRTAWASMQSQRSHRLARLIQGLSPTGRFEDTPVAIDRRQAAFWPRAAVTGALLTRERFMLYTLRACVWALMIICAVTGLVATGSKVGSDSADWHAAISASSVLGSTILGGWLLFAGCWWFDQWQGQPETAPTRWPWLRRLAMPLLCICGVSIQLSPWAHGFGGMLSALSFVFSVRRFRRRTPAKGELLLRAGRMGPAIIFFSLILGAPLAHKMDESDFLTAAMALLGIALWGLDMWLHRAHWHPKLARN